ncbi:enoyl-CoA hydratase/isomerase family protein [Sulfobacillus harzensis]|uniref:Enoyl-CoA hydratase n=1 Tax=Sulfobacillus harzensis TaxID=2729629 RepID=A0A7Y0L0G6_9FIRM|nr:enoyl-CoA hydratase-related protein [Sulfobacillus harzensis]NMP20950.1 enoyl-CoA hydratase [Sulfobacillus harzensis]
MESYQWLEFERSDGIATVALNRPETLNALTDELLAELGEAVKQVERDREVRVLVLTGRGRGFCSGQDLKSFQETPGERDIGAHLDRYYHPLIMKLHHLEKPTIAMVNGVVAGAGMSLALACDFRIAAEGARFSQAFVRIGLVPDSGSTYFLPRLIGVSRALEMALTGKMVDDRTALEWGLINQLVPRERLEEATYELARNLAAGPPVALDLIKRGIAYGASHGLSEALEREKDFQIVAARTEDHHSAVQAFFEKKTPIFRGR